MEYVETSGDNLFSEREHELTTHLPVFPILLLSEDTDCQTLVICWLSFKAVYLRIHVGIGIPN